MGTVVAVLAGCWLAAELGLQAWLWARGTRGSSWEWRSFVVLVLAGVVVGNAARPVAEALPWPGPSTITDTIGLVVAVAGIVLRLWSIVALGRFFRGVVNVQDDQYVVRRGPYRVLRHPSYAGALVGIAGLVLVGGSLAALVLVLVVVGAALVYRIRAEERVLLGAHGALAADYDDYAASTARLVPGVW